MSVTERSSASGDTAVCAAVKKCGGNVRLARRRAWVAAGYVACEMESKRSRSLVLCDIVLYVGLLVCAVGGVGVGFLVQLRVRATMVSYSLVLLLSGIGMVLDKAVCTLRDGVAITVTLVDGGTSGCVHGGGVDSVIDTLGDVCVFTSSSVCVKMWGCSVGAIVWASGAWCLMKLLAAVASCSKSLIDVSPFPFDMTLADFLMFRMALTN